MSVTAIFLGVFLIGAGAAAYRGRWRRWAFARPVFSFAIGFGTLYAGLAMVVFGVVTLLGDAVSAGAQRAAAVVVMVLMALMLLSLFWFPPFLTPRWFREERAAQEASGTPPLSSRPRD
ncbi:cytochrome c biogenesis protein CcdA [Microbacterium proteolyticum]|uniref:hypothetical protein n=1 Tax=Microbacterium proteolyticum TaxID=1572644 RepID=UPI00277DEFD6|nr:hypothetical protein [Microbacterium proteolyticum]MDQ1169692.1 cytochrome c biogenesis protein CcdA [Microbacterium proteolyticum]